MALSECAGGGGEQAESANAGGDTTPGTSLSGKPLPAQLMALVQACGVYQLLEQEGLIAPKK